jgi:hypothetical protein
MMKSAWVMSALLAVGTTGYAQQPTPIGSVVAADATVTSPAGAMLPIAGGRSTISGAATITARAGKNADVALTRGGSLLVCQTTALRVTPGKDDALLLSLNRGAMEIRIRGTTGDLIMTPDLRFTLAEPGALDLQMRVTFNGDTCVDNRGHKAPALNITDAFGDTNYLLKPGQHVTFEGGSLRAVMDRETTPCGCPPDEQSKRGLSIADAVLSGGQTTPGTAVTPQASAAAHPFPEAVSEGLAAPATPPPAVVGERHVQVASTLSFDPNGPAAAAPVPVPPATPPAPPARLQSSNPFVAIGHFFKRIFVR